MVRKIKKTVGAIIVYIVLTVGIQMFLFAYTNSYNRMTAEKIKPASLVVSEENAELQILNKSYVIKLGKISPENKLFFVSYLILPEEIRAELPLFLLHL